MKRGFSILFPFNNAFVDYRLFVNVQLFGKKFVKPAIGFIDALFHAGLYHAIVFCNRLVREFVGIFKNFLVNLYQVVFAVRPCYETVKRCMRSGLCWAFGSNTMKRRQNFNDLFFRR